MSQKISLDGQNFMTKEPTFLVILSGESVTERLSFVFSTNNVLMAINLNVIVI